ncbi:hypothetical protein V2J09_009614 [Rumex salicifolius]
MASYVLASGLSPGSGHLAVKAEGGEEEVARLCSAGSRGRTLGGGGFSKIAGEGVEDGVESDGAELEVSLEHFDEHLEGEVPAELPQDAKLVVVRANEAHHRDVNHFPTFEFFY